MKIAFIQLLKLCTCLIFTFILPSIILAQQWVNVTPGEFSQLKGSFINKNQGWIAKSGKIFYTNDGADTFEEIYIYLFESFNKLFMVDSLHGYCTVNNNDTNYFLRTNTGGYSWDNITDTSLMVNGPLNWSTGYFFLNQDTGFYGGLNCVYKTTDSGDTWSEMIAPKPGIDPILMGESYGVREIFFFGGQFGWAACSYAIDGGIILKTTNGGEEWEICESVGILTDFWDVHFTDSLKGGAAAYGMGKYIVLTEDNYNSLSYLHYNWPQATYTICYQNDSTIWVSGVPAILSRSINSGESFSIFQTIEIPGITNPGINDIQFFGNTGFTFGHNFLLKFQDTITGHYQQNNLKSQLGLKIWPVPVKNWLNLKLFSEIEDYIQITIYSANTGEKAFSVRKKVFCGENDIKVNLEELKTGFYFLVIQGKEQIYTQKLIKN